MDKQIVVRPRNRRLLPAVKGNEQLIQVMVCMELKSVMSHTKDYIFYVMSFLWHSVKDKIIAKESISVVVQEGGGGG